MGSKDETTGNQSCRALVQEDGRLTLHIRLPKALEQEHGKYFCIKDLYFAYGHEAILASLESCEERKQLKKKGDTRYKEMGQALSYRFQKDHKGWRVFLSTSLAPVETITKEDYGAIGIDINADHIACVETDRYGNPIAQENFPWNTYGKSSKQVKALTGDISKALVDWAQKVKKPLVLEDLDFHKKKLFLKAEGFKRHARMLSSFAYSLFAQNLNSRAYRYGVLVHKVNQIGRAHV